MSDETKEQAQPEPFRLVKRGETSIEMTLRRSGKGVTLTVRAHPTVEEFVRGMGSGEAKNVGLYGRYWTPISSKELTVYHLQSNPGNMVSEDGSFFTINSPGMPLIIDQGEGTIGRSGLGINPSGLINLSFLRLVGISEGTGVTFGIKGVYTIDTLKQLRERLGMASRRFYVTYLKPIDLTVSIITQELNL